MGSPPAALLFLEFKIGAMKIAFLRYKGLCSPV